jgi:segregation and condensation protein A
MYRIQLEQFEGPLDLLLYFIRRDEIDILDIPIRRITAEYMATLDLMRRLNLAVAGEFIDMAATLMRIKARMLLPRAAAEDEEAAEDPRTELVRQLLEYQRFKEASEQLEARLRSWQEHFPRNVQVDLPAEEEDPGVFLREVNLFDLARYFKAAMERMPVIRTYELQREPVSLEDQKALIRASFDRHGKLRFSHLIRKLETKLEVVITFLAILDMIQKGELAVVQTELFGEIELRAVKQVA